MRLAAACLMLALLAPAAAGQIASSPNNQLDGISFDSVAGGSSSQTRTVYSQIGPLEYGSIASPSFKLDIGFLTTFDPDPGDLPIVYGVLPRHADKAGGTLITLYGRNLGLGLSPTITVDGNSIFPNVLSKTKAQGISPAGAPSLVDVTVTHVNGSMTLEQGFGFSPAIILPEFAYIGSLWPFRAMGPSGQVFGTWLSVAELVPPAPTKFGPLKIAPPLIMVLPPAIPYLDGGITDFTIPLPPDPLLIGFSLYVQNLNVNPSSPPGQLTNLAQTEFK